MLPIVLRERRNSDARLTLVSPQSGGGCPALAQKKNSPRALARSERHPLIFHRLCLSAIVGVVRGLELRIGPTGSHRKDGKTCCPSKLESLLEDRIGVLVDAQQAY